MRMPVFPAIFERFARNLLNVDGSATQLPTIGLAILLDGDSRWFEVRRPLLLHVGPLPRVGPFPLSPPRSTSATFLCPV